MGSDTGRVKARAGSCEVECLKEVKHAFTLRSHTANFFASELDENVPFLLAVLA